MRMGGAIEADVEVENATFPDRLERETDYHDLYGRTMSNPNPISPLRESDYEAIEAAVMETEKGRWFLAEYARRNRSSDTETVLNAISGLERLLKRERRPDVDRIRFDIAEMKDAIERTKLEIAQIKLDRSDESRFETASNELDAIVTHTEAATSSILDSAEKMQEVIWTMREGGIDGEVCDALESLVMTIYESCSFQDLTGQRTQKVVHVLRYLESRIDAMIDIWGMEEVEVADRSAAARSHAESDQRPDAHLLNGPAREGEGVGQSEVDDLFGAVGNGTEVGADFNDQDFDTIEFDAIEFDAIEFDGPEAGPEEMAAAEETEEVYPDPERASVFAAADDIDETASLDRAVGLDGGVTAVDEQDAEASGVLARATEAMEEAIGTLREVAAGTAAPRQVRKPSSDPLDGLSKSERQALFS